MSAALSAASSATHTDTDALPWSYRSDIHPDVMRELLGVEEIYFALFVSPIPGGWRYRPTGRVDVHSILRFVSKAQIVEEYRCAKKTR